MSNIPLNLDDLENYNNLFSISERKELIGQALRMLRTECGLTQAQLAKHLGVKVGTYGTYENGTREMPAELIVRASILFGLPTDVILQKEARTRDIYDARKRIESVNEQMADFSKLITESELNPKLKEMLEAMTDAFTKFGNKLQDSSDN